MDPEIIDWENIESEFVEDDEYENIDAPKWVDLLIPDELLDDEAWFCKSGCKHPKTAEDFLKLKNSFKMKLLRSMTISEFRPFRDKSRRGGLNLKQPESGSAPKRLSTKEFHHSQKFQTDAENQNPNYYSQIPSFSMKTRKEATNCSTKKKLINGSSENPSARDRIPQLKDTFSARNLLKGREILNQITEFCTGLKRMATKITKKGAGEKDSIVVSTETKKTTGERRRPPLLEVK